MLTTARPIPFTNLERKSMGDIQSTFFLVETSVPMYGFEVKSMLEEAYSVWHDDDDPNYTELSVLIVATG